MSRGRLQTCDAYGLDCQVVLSCGRTVTVEGLDQVRTYAGLLAGYPSTDSNARLLERALQAAEERWPSNGRPHLLPPPRRPYRLNTDDVDGQRERRPARPPEWLPAVRCVASFTDVRPARDRSEDGSALTVVWFQDEFAPPVLEPALSQLLAIDWEALATDFSW